MCHKPLMAHLNEKTSNFIGRVYCSPGCTRADRRKGDEPTWPRRQHPAMWHGVRFEDDPVAVADHGGYGRLIRPDPNRSPSASAAAWAAGLL